LPFQAPFCENIKSDLNDIGSLATATLTVKEKRHIFYDIFNIFFERQVALYTKSDIRILKISARPREL